MINKKIAEVKKFLNSLGDTSDQIADNIQGYGVTGKRGNTYACVLSRLIRQEFGLQVGTTHTGIYFGDNVNNIYTRYILHTEPTLKFVKDFDRGVYPKLEDTSD